MRWVALGCCLSVCVSVPTVRADTIALDDVLASVETHHPEIAEAVANEAAAQAALLGAEGAFDPQLNAYGALRTGGYYELRRATVEIRQPTPLWGVEVWAGYRIGQGIEDQRYPTYYEDETLDQGEIRGGIRIPLWRDGPYDARRAERDRRGLQATAATASRQAATLSVRQQATDAYFAWLAAGRRYGVARELLTLAESRRSWVEARAAAGAIPPVELLEAERAVLRRQSAMVSARRGTEATGFVLSLFYRTAEGTPRIPTLEALPTELPSPPELSDLDERSIVAAIDCHPRVEAMRNRLAAAHTERELAEAQNAPKVDVQGQISRDFGAGDVTLPGTVFEAGVVFSMPLAMRTPRGRERAARARVTAIEQDLRLAEDTLRAQLIDAESAFAAAGERRALASSLTDNTRALAAAERRRFEAGTTTLFVVNLREQSIAEAAIAEVDATRDLWKARAARLALTTCRAPAT